jgi:hypothetical protein
MFAILFETPLGAAALAGGAVSIPVIIHLLNRRRFKVVTWAAMRFLLAAQKKNSRRMRLEQLLLLLLRCVLVLLVVLAMASVTGWAEALWRWWNPEGSQAVASGGGRAHKVLVIDGSLSLNARVGDTTCFEKARALAQQLVQEGSGGDGYSVVLMASSPRRIVPEPSEDSRKVLKEIEALKPTHGNADLAGTLATVASLLKSSPGKFLSREVYFFTDLQASTWISHRPAELASSLQTFQERKAKAIFVDVGQDGLNNLAITGLEVGEPVVTPGVAIPIIATVHNYGDTRDDVSVRLFVGRARAAAADKPCELRQVAESERIRVERGHQRPVPFTYKFPGPGEYVIQAQIEHDALELDDIRSAVVTVKNTVPVLLVNGKSAPEAFDRATEWLRVALNPFEENERIPISITARPKVITPTQFADEGQGDLTPYDCVYLCDVPRVGAPEVRRLESHVRRGGGVVISLGDKVADLNAWNDLLYKGGEGLLPARLVSKQTPRPGYTYQMAIDSEAHRKSPLEPFPPESAARERLLAARFRQFIQTESPARVGARQVLRLVSDVIPGQKALAANSTPPPGGALLWEWQPPAPRDRDAIAASVRDGLPPPPQPRLRGRVILITTTVNSDWNNWPASPAFPPLMQEVLHLATSGRLRERSATVGEPLELFLSSGASGAEAVVQTPDGRQETIRAQRSDDNGTLHWLDTDTSGIYRMTVGQHPREHLFAVNVPALNESQQQSESDLHRTNREDLQKSYPEWDVQVVGELRNVVHATAAVAGDEKVFVPQGPRVARVLLLGVLVLTLLEVVLAWQFGHYSATAGTLEEPRTARGSRWPIVAFRVGVGLVFAAVLTLGAVLLHHAVTGDFLGFLPEGLRQVVERWVGVPPPAPGEGSRWRLEYTPFFVDRHSDPWLAVGLVLAAAVGVVLIYRQEGHNISQWIRAILVALRLGLVAVLLAVLLPQLSLFFERQGWPDVVLLIDDSLSMSTFDVYREERVKNAADQLAQKAELTSDEQEALLHALASRPELTKASRLRLAQTLLTQGTQGENWPSALLNQRKVRLHVYRCSTRAHRLADITTPEEVAGGLQAVRDLRADPENDSSQLGAAVRQVLNDFRGSSLAAVVMLTDGVTTEGEDLGKVSKYAAQMGVPLFFVGLGDAQELRDVFLHDLQVEDSVYVNDRLVFELKLTAQGYSSLNLPVALYEKGKDRPLDTKTVQVDAQNKTVKVRLTHRPTEPGEKIYVIKVPPQEGEIDKDNNVIERPVFVREAKMIKVLYVEGYRRYEYHYLKTLLERESNRIKGNKSIDLKVFLVDADQDFATQDASALSSFPTKEELKNYDVVIWGDVDPEPRDLKLTENMKDVAEFVRERGGGLLVLAGERFSPRAYKTTPLKDVLPIDLTDKGGEEDEANLVDTYRPELTPVGRVHPIFRFSPDEKESEEIWKKLREMFWYADGYEPKRAAEILAVHPRVRAGRKPAATDKESPDRHPLVVQQFVGAGRSMFFGFNETWRWNWREEQLHYNQFWIQTIRYLSRSRLGRIELRLDRQTPYRRGEPIKATVRFPDDAPAPSEKTPVKVVVERRTSNRPGETEVRTVGLTYLPGSRATFETLLTQTPEGDYRFWLSEPTATPRPRAECKVLAPPGEMERLRMNQAEMERAAAETSGRFYTLADAPRLLDELPAGTRISVHASGPPFLVWNQAPIFLLVLGLLSLEWVLRKQKNLL